MSAPRPVALGLAVLLAAALAAPAHATTTDGSGDGTVERVLSGEAAGSGISVVKEEVYSIDLPASATSGSEGGGTEVPATSVGYSTGTPGAAAGARVCSPAHPTEILSVTCRSVPVEEPPAEVEDEEPVPASQGGTVVVTSRDVATLMVQGSGITRQPPGGEVVRTLPFIVYTSAQTRVLTTTLGGVGVDVEVTPTSFTWDWGDGTSTTTTDPGSPYPHHTVFHYYATTAAGVRTSLTTTWSARFRAQGGSDWQDVAGSVSTTETTDPYDVVRLATVLTDDAEEAQGH